MENIKQAIKAALAAGKDILDVYESADFEVDFKSDNSPLTLADRKSHNTIMEYLKKTGYPVLSEEGGGVPYEERKGWKTYWLIDPLDGTKEFIKRNGDFTVNIALIEDGVPVSGIVYVPVTDELFYAVDQRAYFVKNAATVEDFSNAKEINASLPETDELKVVASRSHLNQDTEDFIGKLKENGYKCTTQSRGSSLKLCQVAQGAAHIYPRFAPTMEWDTAAAHAVCRGADAVVIDRTTGKELVYNKEHLLNNHFVVFPKAWSEIYKLI